MVREITCTTDGSKTFSDWDLCKYCGPGFFDPNNLRPEDWKPCQVCLKLQEAQYFGDLRT